MTSKRLLATLLVCLLSGAGVAAQQELDVADVPDLDQVDAGSSQIEFFRVLNSADLDAIREAQARASHASLDLGWRHHGLSFGNAAVWHGVRFNWRDEALRDVRGLNVTLWTPGPNVGGRVDALSLGLWGPRADELNGVSLGLVSVRARAALRGLWFGGLVARSRSMTGVGLSLFSQVARGPAQGVFVALGANVAARDHRSGFDRDGREYAPLPESGWGPGVLHGVAVGGFANSHVGGVRGVQVASHFNVSGANVDGLQLAALANVSRGDLRGVQVAGFNSTVEHLSGAQLGLFCDTRSADGLLLSGIWSMNSETVRGLALTGGVLYCDELWGLSVGGLLNTSRRTRGLQLGLWNVIAEELRGVSLGVFNQVQGAGNGYLIGLLNHVPENPEWLRWLPLFNTGLGGDAAVEPVLPPDDPPEDAPEDAPETQTA